MFFLFALLLVSASAQTCSLCEFVVQTVEGFLLNNSTETEILSWLESTCTFLPSPYSDLCKQEIDQYGPEVIQWIANKENPEVVCQQLHLCTTQKVAPLVGKPLQTSCSVCELVVSFAENYLQNNGTVAGLEAALEGVCAVLPSPYNTQCTAFIEAQLPALIQWLVNNEPPQQFCTQIGLCTSTKVEPVIAHKTLQTSCSVCELVVTFAENYLQNNGTVAGLEAALEGVCAVLPSPYNTQCTAFIEAQLPALIQWLVNNEPPQQFCTQIGLCTSAKNAAVVEPVVIDRKALQSTCSICELVVSFAENYLQNNGTVAGLEAALDGVCAVLPSPFNTECTSLVNTQLPAIIQWIVSNESPQQFCTQANFCTSTEPHRRLNKKL